MTDIKKKKKGKDDIQWHPAFVVALKLTLIDYDDVLEYKLEHPLNTGSLKIDVMVVKKRPDAVIKKQVAEIFRKENIIEYKSPADSLTVDEFYRAFTRAMLHKVLDKVDIADMTLSFVVAVHPRELFKHLRNKLGYTAEERHPGVYVMKGAMMPIQIIDIRELSEEENTWIRSLNRNLSEKNLLWAQDMKEKYDNRVDMNAWLQAVFTANHQAIKEIFSREGNNMLAKEFRRTIEEIGLGAIWRQEGFEEGELKGIKKGIEKGIEEGKLEDARAMFAEGFDIKIISRVTKIPAKTLKKKLSVQ